MSNTNQPKPPSADELATLLIQEILSLGVRIDLENQNYLRNDIISSENPYATYTQMRSEMLANLKAGRQEESVMTFGCGCLGIFIIISISLIGYEIISNSLHFIQGTTTNECIQNYNSKTGTFCNN